VFVIAIAFTQLFLVLMYLLLRWCRLHL